MTDPTNLTDLNTIWQALSPFLSKTAATDIGAAITITVTVASIVMRFWKPPAVGSKWVRVWNVVSFLAQARGWSTPAYQPGAKAIMVPVSTPRDEASRVLGLDPLTTKPACPKSRETDAPHSVDNKGKTP